MVCLLLDASSRFLTRLNKLNTQARARFLPKCPMKETTQNPIVAQ